VVGCAVRHGRPDLCDSAGAACIKGNARVERQGGAGDWRFAGSGLRSRARAGFIGRPAGAYLASRGRVGARESAVAGEWLRGACRCVGVPLRRERGACSARDGGRGQRAFGRIDVLVNDAGIIMVGPLESQTLDSFHEAMNVNFFGALHLTLAVLPQMLERGEGAIVNIGSIGGKVAFPHLLPYVASKFAITGWSQGLRAELAGKGIRVTTVSPGIMRTGSHIQARFTGNQEQEYRWFAAAASLPGAATNATSAATKIVRALATGSAEISIGLQAIIAARLSNIAPELTATLLSLANTALPSAPSEGDPDFWQADRSTAGKAFRGSLPAVIERLGTRRSSVTIRSQPRAPQASEGRSSRKCEARGAGHW
jgi:short-subunit dehydrogenase